MLMDRKQGDYIKGVIPERQYAVKTRLDTIYLAVMFFFEKRIRSERSFFARPMQAPNVSASFRQGIRMVNSFMNDVLFPA